MCYGYYLWLDYEVFAGCIGGCLHVVLRVVCRLYWRLFACCIAGCLQVVLQVVLEVVCRLFAGCSLTGCGVKTTQYRPHGSRSILAPEGITVRRPTTEGARHFRRRNPLASTSEGRISTRWRNDPFTEIDRMYGASIPDL